MPDLDREPGPQHSECPESHWRITDLLMSIGLVVACIFFALGG
jgi:hypothetical protein